LSETALREEEGLSTVQEAKLYVPEKEPSVQVRVSEEQVAGDMTVSEEKAMTETPLATVEPHGAVQEAGVGAGLEDCAGCDGATIGAGSGARGCTGQLEVTGITEPFEQVWV
jgi:hypothetical protein